MLKLFKNLFGFLMKIALFILLLQKHSRQLSNIVKITDFLYEFTADDEVVIDGIKHEIYRGYDSGSRGNYGIKCREK